MARKQARPPATKQRTLDLVQTSCRACGSRLMVARHSHRKVTTLDGVYCLTVKVYHCLNRECPGFRQVCRPEEEGGWALPHGECGLDVIAPLRGTALSAAAQYPADSRGVAAARGQGGPAHGHRATLSL